MLRKHRTHDHPELGRLTHARRAWRGHVALDAGSTVRLSIMGTRSEPDPDGLALAGTVAGKIEQWRPAIEAALREHASDAGAIIDEIPDPSFVAVVAIDGVPTIEFGFDVPWDDDHTVGVCVRDDVVVEVNGSILEP